MKKLFLFTLFISSFLVISCSNKDITAPTTAVIDSKFYGTYNYSAITEIGVPIESKMTVSENGISSRGSSPASIFMNNQLKKVSENVYQTEESLDSSYIKFEFYIIDTAAKLIVTDYKKGQASAPKIHTKIASVISAKWYGTYKYSGTTETGVPVESTLTVNENGILFYVTENGKPVSGGFMNNQFKKVSDNVYQAEEVSVLSYIKFEFASTDTGKTLTMTDYINGQASTPKVHNR